MMRIGIDIQSGLATGQNEATGRHVRLFLEKFLAQSAGHSVELIVNDSQAAAALELKSHFRATYPQVGWRVFSLPGSCLASKLENDWRRNLGEISREAFLERLGYDVVLQGSPLEGYGEEVLSSVGRFSRSYASVAILPDLPPRESVGSERPSPRLLKWHADKLEELGRMDLLLTHAEEIRRRAIEDLGCDEDKVVNISKTTGWEALSRFEIRRSRARGTDAQIQSRLARTFAAQRGIHPEEPGDFERLCQSLAANDAQISHPVRQLLVDVTEFYKSDWQGGVQKVTGSILRELIQAPPEGMNVVPVARASAKDFRGDWFVPGALLARLNGEQDLPDRGFDTGPGDIFLGVDCHFSLARDEAWVARQRMRGVEFAFIAYDLIPVRHPSFFSPEMTEICRQWLGMVQRHATWVAGISQATADDFRAWCSEHEGRRPGEIKIGHFRLAAGEPAKGEVALPDSLERAMSGKVFLVVGTIEPRKGHRQILEAFERLWNAGHQATLVFAGRGGWIVGDWLAGLPQHPESGNRFFWLNDANDATIAELYRRSTALIFASEAEGFGLPIVEAARYGLPMILRDLPVFREVAGNHAFYFAGKEPDDLASAVSQWLSDKAKSGIPRPEGIEILSWADSARELRRTLAL